jgi:hypothetical protein
MRLEGLGQLENPMTSLGIEAVTFKLVAQCLNHLRYRVLQCLSVLFINYLMNRKAHGKCLLGILLKCVLDFNILFFSECVSP